MDGPIKLAIIVVGKGNMEVVINELNAVSWKIDRKEVSGLLVRSMKTMAFQSVQWDSKFLGRENYFYAYLWILETTKAGTSKLKKIFIIDECLLARL